MKKKVIRLSLITSLIALSSSASASGFMLSEQNAVQTGDFGAGGAAIAEDASTAWFNPAGLVRVTKPEVVLAGNQIDFQTRFSGNVNLQNSGTKSLPPFVEPETTQQSVSNVNGGTNNFVPAFHASYPINNNVVAAFSVTTPFGLSTDYNDSTFVRYAATSTKLRTIDLSPSLGIALNKKVSVGAGIDFQKLQATLDNYVGIQNANVLGNESAGSVMDTYSHNTASDWAKGWHAGFLFQPSNTTRIGLAYHSKMVHHAEGRSVFTGPLADTTPGLVLPNQFNSQASLSTNTANANIYLPANTTLSAYHDMNNRWALMGSVVYTQWSVFKHINMQNVMVAHDDTPDNLSTTMVPTLISANVPENFRNTWRASIGTNYKVDDQWLVRTGVGYDQDPTNNTDRNVRLPDGDRYGVAVGARYQATKNLALDGGYTHEFIKAADINNTLTSYTQTTTTTGKSYSSANVFGLQLTYSFA